MQGTSDRKMNDTGLALSFGSTSSYKTRWYHWARPKTKRTMPSRKSMCLCDIFHWGETDCASVGSCGVLLLMCYQEKGDWISWTAQRALGLPEKGNRLLRWKASVCLPAFSLYWLFAANPKKDGLFFSDHRWAKGFWKNKSESFQEFQP